MTKFFMPPNLDEEAEENQWRIFNKQSNPDNPDKFKKRVYAVREVSVKLELIHRDTVGGNFPDSTIPLCAIIETDNTFDLYGIKLTDTDGVIRAKSYLHQIYKSQYVFAEYFE